MRRASFLSSPCRFAAVSVCQHQGTQRPRDKEVHNSSKVCVHTLSQTQTKGSILVRPYAVLCCVLQCSARGVPVAAVPI